MFCPWDPAITVSFCLSHSGRPIVLPVQNRTGRTACPHLTALFCLSSSSCPDSTCPDSASPDSALLFILSCSACPVLPVLFCLSCFTCPVLALYRYRRTSANLRVRKSRSTKVAPKIKERDNKSANAKAQNSRPKSASARMFHPGAWERKRKDQKSLCPALH